MILIFLNVKKLEKLFSDKSLQIEIDVIKDYDMTPGSRRPKFVMQTCAHVSGAAFLYNHELLEIYSSQNTQPSNGQEEKVSLFVIHTKQFF